MVGVVNLISTGDNIIFCWNFKAVLSGLYKKARIVLFRKNSILVFNSMKKKMHFSRLIKISIQQERTS